ncbi:MAG: methionyl-tRNA formyltransferase [Candidatus Krumholzibacteriia bacterium]
MNIVFMGSPEFAVPCLEAVLDAGHAVPLVVTQPDRPVGRGRKLGPTAVKAAAEAAGLRVLTQDRGRAARQRMHDAVAAAAPDAAVVVAFGHILREPLLSMPRHGCLNVHFSLLPRWRGMSPVQQTLLHGDAWTGVSVIRMDEGVDTGPLLDVQTVPVLARETGGELLERLGHLGAERLVASLAALAAGALAPQPQGEVGVVYAPRLTRSLSPVRWDRDAVTVHNQIRALDPFPGTTSYLGDKLLKIGRAEPVGLHTPGAAPGTVLGVEEAGITVACGGGCVRLLALQAPGRRMLAVGEFLRGCPVEVGQVFTS